VTQAAGRQPPSVHGGRRPGNRHPVPRAAHSRAAARARAGQPTLISVLDMIIVQLGWPGRHFKVPVCSDSAL
jgi:hypothetical protein